MKYRYSKQRDLIYTQLKESKKHLTAEEVHKLVKRKDPKIGLGTVYRNLGILADQGVVQKLTLTDRALFEVDDRPHHHLICKYCGSIKNVYSPATFKCVQCLDFVRDFTVDQAFINAYGRCSKC